MRIEFVFRDEQEAADAIESFRASQLHTLADRLYHQIEEDRDELARAQEHQRLRAEERAARAANHVLTKRQAEVLASIRAGKGARQVPYSWKNHETGAVSWSWRHTRSMGGAVSRMIETMMGEGLVYPYRTEGGKGGTATPAGLERLAAYEAKHGRVGP